MSTETQTKKMSKNFLQTSHQMFADNMQRISGQMEEVNTQERAKLMGVPYLNFHTFPPDLNTLGLISEEEARQLQAVPFFREQNHLRIAAVNPKDPAVQA